MCGRADRRAALGPIARPLALNRWGIGKLIVFSPTIPMLNPSSSNSPNQFQPKSRKPSTILLKRGECSMGWLVIRNAFG